MTTRRLRTWYLRRKTSNAAEFSLHIGDSFEEDEEDAVKIHDEDNKEVRIQIHEVDSHSEKKEKEYKKLLGLGTTRSREYNIYNIVYTL